MATTTMYDKFYGKMEEPARERRKREARDENMEEKEKENEKEPKGFFNRFASAMVDMKLVDGEVLTDNLDSNGYNKYDVLLQTENSLLLIPKHGILWIRASMEKEGGGKINE